MTPRVAAGDEPAGRGGTTLLVANFPSDVGYAWWLMEHFWASIARGVAARGGRTILAYPEIREVPAVVREAPLEIVEQKISSYPGWVWRSFRFIRKHRVTNVYLTDWPYLHVGYCLWRLAGVKRIVLHAHTSAALGRRETGLRAFVKDALYRVGLFSATTYVAVADHAARRMQEVRRVPASQLRVVTNGIRPFAADPARRQAIRAAIGVPDDAILVALVSRATRAKGIDVAVQAFARLAQDPARRRVYAVHCGDGPELSAFTAQASVAGVGERFRFLGRRSDVREILGAADIGLHPSRGEAMSLAVLELMSAGLAVVTSNVPSVAVAIDPERTGLTYASEDVSDAARVLARVVDDPALRRRLGDAAAESCRRTYSLEAMDAAFEATVHPALFGP